MSRPTGNANTPKFSRVSLQGLPGFLKAKRCKNLSARLQLCGCDGCDFQGRQGVMLEEQRQQQLELFGLGE
jgi:hypothetical protein